MRLLRKRGADMKVVKPHLRVLLLVCVLSLTTIFPACTGVGTQSLTGSEAYTYYTDGKFDVIETAADNIMPQVIHSNVCDTPYIGINACFFDVSTNDGLGISWYAPTKDDSTQTHTQNSVGVPDMASPDNDPVVARGTICGYIDITDPSRRIHAVIAPVKYEKHEYDPDAGDPALTSNMEDMLKAMDPSYQPVYMIGGGSLYLDDAVKWAAARDDEQWWDSQLVYRGEYSPNARTGMGYRTEKDGSARVFLVSSRTGNDSNITTADLRDEFIKLGCDGAIFLDGGESVEMQCMETDNTPYKKNPQNWAVYNMVRLIDPLMG